MTKEHDQRIINLRNAIDTVDSRIIELLQERSSLAREIGNVKKEIGMEILDPSREGQDPQETCQRHSRPYGHGRAGEDL